MAHASKGRWKRISAEGLSSQINGNVFNFNSATHHYAAPGPGSMIRDAALLGAGIFAGWIAGTRPDANPEPISYRKMNGDEFFDVGRVFDIPWVEPEGVQPADEQTHEGSDPSKSERRHQSQVGRFVVVIRGGRSCSNCLSIVSYGANGVSKPGSRISEHSIVYTSRSAPALTEAEQPQRGEQGLLPITIRVVADEKVN